MQTIKEKEDEVKTFFKIFDLNVDGSISDQELKRLLGTFGENLSKNDLQSLVKTIQTYLFLLSI
jgi:Ca2+-binding EF-hand superfamily protein